MTDVQAWRDTLTEDVNVTMEAQLRYVAIKHIFPNPHRNLEAYPAEEDRVKLLMESITDIGWFPGGVTVRSIDKEQTYQLAFGHKRLEAARRLFGVDHELSVILRHLDDGEMLHLMIRENLTETGRSFLVMLETWEATLRFLRGQSATEPSAKDIARVLGWAPEGKSRELTDLAYACSAAHKLLEEGIIERSSFSELRIGQARELARSLHGRLRGMTGKIRNLSPERISQEKAALSNHAVTVVKSLRRDDAQNESRTAVRAQLLRAERGSGDLPDFVGAVRMTRSRLAKWLVSDLDDRVNVLCDVSDNLNVEEIDHLRWLGNDIQAITARLQKQLEKIRRVTDNVPTLDLNASRLTPRKMLGRS